MQVYWLAINSEQPRKKSELTDGRPPATISNALGDVAQLGERSVRNAEAEGSNPFISTMQSQARGFAPGLFLSAS